MRTAGCSLVPVREVAGSRGGPLGSQQTKVVFGGQMKGCARKARKPITLGKSLTHCQSIVTNICLRYRQDGAHQEGSVHERCWGVVHVA